MGRGGRWDGGRGTRGSPPPLSQRGVGQRRKGKGGGKNEDGGRARGKGREPEGVRGEKGRGRGRRGGKWVGPRRMEVGRKRKVEFGGREGGWEGRGRGGSEEGREGEREGRRGKGGAEGEREGWVGWGGGGGERRHTERGKGERGRLFVQAKGARYPFLAGINPPPPLFAALERG